MKINPGVVDNLINYSFLNFLLLAGSLFVYKL